MDTKTAVYICTGCGIGEAVDLEALRRVAGEDAQTDPCRDHACLCSPEGVALIQQDLQGGPRPVVIAACSQRFCADRFAFPGCLVDRVSLRELVAWSHPPREEETQLLAEDYLRMGLVRVQKAELPQPHTTEVDKTVLVVGGGLTGLTAALETARAGRSVVVVEKEPQLGGMQRTSCGSFPHRLPYQEIESPAMPDLVRDVTAQDRIKVHTATTIKKIAGQPGQFDVEIQSNGSSETLRVGAIIQATGWQPYDASRLTHLGYGRCPNVITNVQMEEQLAAGQLRRPSDGKPARRIAFVQCAGSRDAEHLPYCSAVCCRVTLKQALKARSLDGDVQAYVFYKDIRTPGQSEAFYRRAQEDPGIFFTKGDVVGVEEGVDHVLRVGVENTLIDPRIRVEADLVVLAVGMVPVSVDGEALREYTDAKAALAKEGEAGPAKEAAQATIDRLKHLEGQGILHLDYRQGPDLPVLSHQFPDSHFICFPYETRRTGIYAAGCVRAPADTDVCRADAAGAALKAVQCLEMTSRGEAVHPRWGDTSFPDFFLQRCTQCKRCTEECPFGALNEDVKGTPQPNITRCRRCGICLGACPERIVSYKDYSIDSVSSMIKSVPIPGEEEEKYRLLGLVCENDAWPVLDLAAQKRLHHSASIRFLPVRCLGSINVVWIADALSRGFDGILLLGCKSGPDYQCHFIRGSELMGRRSVNIQEKLKQLALETERVRLEEISIADYERLPDIIGSFASQIESVGMNPFKGF